MSWKTKLFKLTPSELMPLELDSAANCVAGKIKLSP
jgi:hypothetical protein